jgi:FMN reductase
MESQENRLNKHQLVKIVGIGGSLRSESYTYQALKVAINQVADLGAITDILDLRTMNLPFCNGSEAYPDYPDVQKLQRTVAEADGLILASPEYHGSISGVLKNALDLMSFDQLDGKVMGAISVLGGEANSNALNDLRLIMRWVHGWVIPEQIAVGRAWQAFDDQGQIKDPKLAQRFEKFAHSLVENTSKLRCISS